MTSQADILKAAANGEVAIAKTPIIANSNNRAGLNGVLGAIAATPEVGGNLPTDSPLLPIAHQLVANFHANFIPQHPAGKTPSLADFMKVTLLHLRFWSYEEDAFLWTAAETFDSRRDENLIVFSLAR